MAVEEWHGACSANDETMTGMELESGVGIVIAVVLAAYLVYALLYPDRF